MVLLDTHPMLRNFVFVFDCNLALLNVFLPLLEIAIVCLFSCASQELANSWGMAADNVSQNILL